MRTLNKSIVLLDPLIVGAQEPRFLGIPHALLSLLHGLLVVAFPGAHSEVIVSESVRNIGALCLHDLSIDQVHAAARNSFSGFQMAGFVSRKFGDEADLAFGVKVVQVPHLLTIQCPD